MRISFSSKTGALTEEFRALAQRRLSKLSRYLRKIDLIDIAHSQQRNWCVLDVLVHADGFLVRAEERAGDLRSALDLVADKLERQIRKYRGKLVEHTPRRAESAAAPLPDEEEPTLAPPEPEEPASTRIVRAKRFALKPMSPEEAVAQMELLGHDFYVFTNSETAQTNVIYRRRDGDYGLIEPEF